MSSRIARITTLAAALLLAAAAPAAGQTVKGLLKRIPKP